jgi:hypothetical protein
MEAQNNLSPQEEGVIHILQASLEQEQILRDQISNPPVSSSQPVLKPEGWVIQSTPLPEEADRIVGLEAKLAEMKAKALTNIEMLSGSLPADKQQQIAKDSLVVLYADPNAGNSFYRHRDLDKSQGTTMAILANEQQNKTLSAEDAAIRMTFPQFFPQQEMNIERLIANPTLSLGSEGFNLSSHQKAMDQNIDLLSTAPAAEIGQPIDISTSIDLILLSDAPMHFLPNADDITEPEMD